MKSNRKKLFPSTILLLVLAIALMISPLIFLKGAEFEGADDLAGEAILELAPNYEPWFEPIFEPSSDGMEKVLFLLQGAIGGGIILYVLGHMRKTGKKETV
ncbi:cobalt/nickel transport protein [Anaerovirgula multivorans]|uniref:Cobalt transport protein CbiN n=1 Tax=Anaerovirgula multivorans TaxID=312168 RepID=A0A239ENY6_9FIRM|nr:energy-coupling factor ABC transporter substrate-binding protein [Anaerovirgula multivorans]SNS46111.1 cobalt/nickel transport protein [Anaerovirgula multivorans]